MFLFWFMIVDQLFFIVFWVIILLCVWIWSYLKFDHASFFFFGGGNWLIGLLLIDVNCCTNWLWWERNEIDFRKCWAKLAWCFLYFVKFREVTNFYLPNNTYFIAGMFFFSSSICFKVYDVDMISSRMICWFVLVSSRMLALANSRCIDDFGIECLEILYSLHFVAGTTSLDFF